MMDRAILPEGIARERIRNLVLIGSGQVSP